MKTRNQIKIPDINFDEAHKEWMKNKKKNKLGTYSYICGKLLKNGNICQKIDKNHGCSCHSFWNK
jgi:hypothetical protein